MKPIILTLLLSCGEVPIAGFTDAKACGDTLPFLLVDAVCAVPLETLAPAVSVRPKRNPIYEGSK